MPGKNYEIKTTLSMDGEQKFKQAIEDANRSMKVMDSEMRKAKAAYQAGGDGVDYYNAKAEAMSGKVKQQEAIVKALEQAVEESAKAYGEASKQADTYRIKLNQAEATLIKMRKASKDADKEAEELGRDAKKVGQQIEDGIGDGAEQAAEDVKDSFGSITDSLNDLRNHAAVQTTLQVGQFIVEGIQSVMGFVDENAELTRQIAIAQYNVERYGMRWADVENLIVDAAAITGDYEGSMAAVTSLLQAGFSDVGLLEAAMNALLGGYLSRPGLSMESLAEDFLATVNTREVSGTLAELLTEVLAVATGEQINEALQGAQSQEEAMQIALSYLTQAGLQTRTAEFQQQNQQLIAYQTAALEMTEEWRELSVLMMPLVSEILNMMSNWLAQMREFIENNPEFADFNQALASGATLGGAARFMGQRSLEREYPEFAGALESGDMDTFGGTARFFFRELWQSITGNTQAIVEDLTQSGEDLMDLLIPSAGAEEMPEGWAEYAANARTQIETELANGTDAAHNAGTQLIADFGAGIEQGTAAPIESVQNMVNQINSLLGSVGGAYGFGLAGAGGVSLVVDGQELGRAVAHGVSTTIGNRVATRMYAD